MKAFYRWQHIKIAFRNIFRSRAGVFRNIYLKRLWRDAESASGPGSNLSQTEELRNQLPSLMKEYRIKTLLDAPCGDLNWISKTPLDLDKYIGADIVPELISQNRKRFRNDPHREFITLDLCQDPLPEADLILVRDAWVHLSYHDIQLCIDNLRKSKIKWLLCTHFPGRLNKDIMTGNWRPLNLESAPFHFPEPVLLINEKCTEAEGNYADKSMGLWKIADLKM